jgi:hypothetical protein
MLRFYTFGLLSLLVVTSCAKRPDEGAPMMARTVDATGADRADGRMRNGGNAALAYSHLLNVELSSDLVEVRYNAVRNLCLTDVNLGCQLLGSEITASTYSAYNSHAELRFRLPHASVQKIEDAVLAPAGKEGTVRIRARSTTAEDLTGPIADIDRRLQLAKDYRERLTKIAARPDLPTNDLIKVESELSNTQQQIENMTAEQRGLSHRVETELLTIGFYDTPTIGSAFQPIGRSFQQAGITFGRNVADAIEFTIGALPYLPLGAVFFVLAGYGWKLFRRIQRGRAN